MSDTPRTDKSLLSKIDRWGKAIGYDDLVLAEFARQLERENAALRVENAALKKALDRLEQKFAAIDAARKEQP